MNKIHNKISTMELFSIVIVLMIIKATDFTTIIVFGDSKTATWMMPMIWSILLFIPFPFLFSILKHHKDKNLIQINYLTFGKYLGFFINLLLFIIVLVASILNTRSYVDIMNTMYFPNTPTSFIYIILLVTSFYIANRGIETIARMSYLFIPFVYLSLILLFIVLIRYFKIEFIFPLFGPGIKPVLKSSLTRFSLVGEFLFLSTLYPYMVNYKAYKRGNIFGFIIALLSISYMFILYLLSFDYIAPQKGLFIYTQLIKYTEIGTFITNLDIIYFTIWIYNGLLRFAIYLYISALVLGHTLKLKQFEPLILPISVLTGIIGLIPNNPITTNKVFRDNLLIDQTWYFFLLFPFVLWLVTKLKRRMQSEKKRD